MHPTVSTVTERIEARSRDKRAEYLRRIDTFLDRPNPRGSMGCSNLAHGMAACLSNEKERIQDEATPTLAIVSAYNDMLSAHKPYENYPQLIREAARQSGAVAQVAGGVPAMCDGVTQGREGMELSLFSRDVIALSTAVALSHDMFDAVLCLGVCDKIVPGLLIGTLSFGHLPTVFIPAGPMPTGMANKDKAAVREAYASGEASRGELLAAESAAYHSPGTCTFYGTANSNQMLLEFMGLQLPGSSFETPDSPMRTAFTQEATKKAVALAQQGLPMGHMVSERSIVNAMVGLLATGGSTNHTLHLLAVANAAGIHITWQDFSDLADVVPLIASIYPNGQADVNQYHQAGGIACTIQELLAAELLQDDVATILGAGLHKFTDAPVLTETGLCYEQQSQASLDHSVLRSAAQPFQADGGLKVMHGNLGEAVVKISAVADSHRAISAPARVFRDQDAFLAAYEAGELNTNFVAVVTHQGPSANGMPELHKLSPYLGALQNQGFSVALLTDGRMSGASGKVLAAIHVTPEAQQGGNIGKLRDGDMVTIDARTGSISVDADLNDRPAVQLDTDAAGIGRELFQVFRNRVGSADTGASIF